MFNFEQLKESLSKQGYEYKQFLGGCGLTSVLLCKSNKLNNDIAIKRSIKHKVTENELNNLYSLDHPNIIKLYEVFHDPIAQYLVMEYCSNGTIHSKGRLSYEKFVVYAKQILEAIAYCHSKKIAHRDISTHKIFIDQNDNIKITNFKFNKNEFDSNSMMFHPPEKILNDEICPFKADIWALGITFFFMASGNYPFQSDNVDEIKKMILKNELDFFKYKIHPKIRLLIKKMTVKNQFGRPSAEELLKLPIFSCELKLPIFSCELKQTVKSYDNGKRRKLSSLRIEHPLYLNTCQRKENNAIRKVCFNPIIEFNRNF